MSQRLVTRDDSRPFRRPTVGGPVARRGRHRYRPAAEVLEGRALMSYGGSPDLTFGTFGQAPYPTAAGSTFLGEASATQGDGKTVVVGTLYTFSSASGIVDGEYLTAARYNTDGTLDTTFGTGGYFTSAALSTPGGSGLPNVYSFNAIAIQPDGDLVLPGSLGNQGVVARLTPAGALDPTFGTGGVVTLGTTGAGDGKVDYAASVGLLPDGQIVVGGSTMSASQLDPAVAKLNGDGSVDTTFGTAGTVVVFAPPGSVGFSSDPASNTSGLVVQPDGKVVIVANSLGDTAGNGILATRYNADGSIDTTFGTGGQSFLSTAYAQSISISISATSLAIQPDGKLVIGGSTYGLGMVVVRLDADGSPDPTFGHNGADVLANTTPFGANAGAIAFQADGKILLADRSNADVTRLDTDGLPDTSFGEGGTAKFPNSSGPQNGLVGVSVLADGKIMAAQSQGSSAIGGVHGLLRLLGQGAAGDYDNDGISDPAVLLTTTAIVGYRPSGGGQDVIAQLGDPGAPFTLPAPGAYDGGGISELAVYRPGSGTFDVKPYAGGPDVITAFGTPGLGNALPAPGDYDGSGKTELAIYSPAQGAYFYRPSNGDPDVALFFGVAGAGQSIPAPADYFGTGQTDFAVYLVAQGAYEIRNPVTGQDYTIPFGTPGAGQAIPVPGDYDGSGFAELAVYVPASGDLIYRPHAGGADVIVPFGTPGVAMTIPAPGDYDGSGHTEVAGYDPTTATFSYLPASGGAAVSTLLGAPGTTVPFSMGTNSVAESGIGSGSGSADFVAGSELPITQDVLDSLAGTAAKKSARSGT